MKKSIFYLFAVVCTVCLFTACSDDDDDNNNGQLTVDNIAGTYNGSLTVTVGGTPTSMPDTKITLSKVNDSKVKVELLDFKFGVVNVGDIVVECAVKENGKKLDVDGTGAVTVGVSLPVVVDGDSDGTTLKLNITIAAVGVVVDYTGTK